VPIDWIFFDMGGVLVDDEPVMLLIYRRLYERCKQSGRFRTPEEIFGLREELIVKGDGAHWHTAGKLLLGDDGWRQLYFELADELRLNYTRYNVPYSDAGGMLSWATEKFNLGLAANQFTECRSILETHGWVDYFKVFGISEEVGLRKPQPEFFQWVLKEADAEPHRCIMVGDRIDNDIVPAKRLGLKTIHVQIRPDYKCLAPVDDFALTYIESHKRAAMKFLAPSNDSEKPDFVAASVGEVMKSIEILTSG